MPMSLSQPTATPLHESSVDALSSAATTLPLQSNIITLIPYATVCRILPYPIPSAQSNTSLLLRTGTETFQPTGYSTSWTDALQTIGADGCSTLYSPTATATCSTILQGMGQAPINVTGCSQWVTFSTERECAAVAGTLSSAETAPRTYYLAPWQAIAAGSVPSNVVAKVCDGGDEDETGDYCVWSLTQSTRTVNVVRTVVYTGPVDGVGRPILFHGTKLTFYPAGYSCPR
jgi:hypothetical protein